MSTEEALSELHKSIWTPYRLGWTNEYNFAEESRELTDSELNYVFDYIKDNDALCEMHNACMGFGCSLTVYKHSHFPGMDPEPLIRITSKHLKMNGGGKFKLGWTAFSPYTHSDRNKELLEYYGKDPAREKYHYNY